MNDVAVRGRPFPAGVSGNPNGRPPGHHTRHLFSEAFMRDLSASWSQNGATVLQRVAKENPSSYFAVCARLLPSDVAVSIQAQAPALDARDLEILRAIKVLSSLRLSFSLRLGSLSNSESRLRHQPNHQTPRS